eukprot:1608526-Rhodomonas_salina.1
MDIMKGCVVTTFSLFLSLPRACFCVHVSDGAHITSTAPVAPYSSVIARIISNQRVAVPVQTRALCWASMQYVQTRSTVPANRSMDRYAVS